MEQRLDPFHPGRRVAGEGRAEVVVDERRIRYRHPGRRDVGPPGRGRSLVAEAGEGEPGATPRGRAEGAELGFGAVVDGGVDVVVARLQTGQLGMPGVDGLTRLRVGVTLALRRTGTQILPAGVAQENPRPAHRLQGVPRHDGNRGRVTAELQMQAVHSWRRHRVVRPARSGLGPGRSCLPRRRGVGGQASDQRSGERTGAHRSGCAQEAASAEGGTEQPLVLSRRRAAVGRIVGRGRCRVLCRRFRHGPTLPGGSGRRHHETVNARRTRPTKEVGPYRVLLCPSPSGNIGAAPTG